MTRRHPKAICETCPLQDKPFVPSRILPKANIIFVGEAPGQHEVNQGVPFVGASGKLLRAALMKGSSISLDDCSLINSVCCRPDRNADPPSLAIECCSGRLIEELNKHSATSVIIGLGNTSRKALAKAGSQGGISMIRGLWWENKHTDHLVTFLVHPAAVLRQTTIYARDFIDGLAQGAKGCPTYSVDDIKHRVLRNRDEVRRVCAVLGKEQALVYDLETDQIGWRKERILCLGIAPSGYKAAVIPGSLLYGQGRPYIADLLEKRGIEWIGHNAKFDIKFLRHQLGINATVTFDTMVAHYALDERTSTRGAIHGLKTLMQHFFGVPDYEKGLVQRFLKSRNDRYSKVPPKHLYRYCALDVCCEFKLYEYLKAILIDQDLYEQPFLFPMMEGVRLFVEAELHGIRVDTEYLEAQKTLFEADIEEHKGAIREVAKAKGLNPNSPKQLSQVMYGILNMPVVTGRGVKARSTNKAARALLRAHPRVKGNPRAIRFLDALQMHRRVAKLYSSYLANVEVTEHGRVHGNFLIHGTEIGRLSIRKPALQTIPRVDNRELGEYGTRIRCMYVASEGHKIVHVDYSQAELRCAALLADEPFLKDVYEHDRDLHSEVARAMFGDNFSKTQRVHCKMFNFAYLYGGSANSFATDTGIPIREAKRFVDRYNEVMPRLAAYRKSQLGVLRSQGYIESLFKRRRRFPIITNRNIDDARKASVHMPVAGLASDLTLISAILIRKLLPPGAHVILLVHDSVLVEAPEELAPDIAELMSKVMVQIGEKYAPDVRWKADADIGDSWGQLEKVKKGD